MEIALHLSSGNVEVWRDCPSERHVAEQLVRELGEAPLGLVWNEETALCSKTAVNVFGIPGVRRWVINKTLGPKRSPNRKAVLGIERTATYRAGHSLLPTHAPRAGDRHGGASPSVDLESPGIVSLRGRKMHGQFKSACRGTEARLEVVAQSAICCLAIWCSPTSWCLSLVRIPQRPRQQDETRADKPGGQNRQRSESLRPVEWRYRE